MDIIVHPSGTLEWQGQTYRCAIGKAGVIANKQEGDHATPIGRWPIRRVLYRADKIAKPVLNFPTTVINSEDGWCDAPEDVNYNQQIVLPYPASCEKLWRDDNMYDIVVVMGYNDEPALADKGSAIFLHVIRDESYPPTEGCVAVALSDMLAILHTADLDTAVVVKES